MGFKTIVYLPNFCNKRLELGRFGTRKDDSLLGQMAKIFGGQSESQRKAKAALEFKKIKRETARRKQKTQRDLDAEKKNLINCFKKKENESKIKPILTRIAFYESMIEKMELSENKIIKSENNLDEIALTKQLHKADMQAAKVTNSMVSQKQVVNMLYEREEMDANQARVDELTDQMRDIDAEQTEDRLNDERLNAMLKKYVDQNLIDANTNFRSEKVVESEKVSELLKNAEV